MDSQLQALLNESPPPPPEQKGLARLKYTHEAMADAILANPCIKPGELAILFNKSPSWMSYILHSDVFKAYLAKRKEELVDPVLKMSIDERLKAVSTRSLDLVMERLNQGVTANYALDVMKAATKALGYGARGPEVSVSNNFVVAMPTKAANPEDWAKNCAATGAPTVDLPSGG